MNEKIKDILKDIYKIDPSLRSDEVEIIKVLEELLEIEPDLEPDEEFVLSLKKQLVESVGPMKVVGKKEFSFLEMYKGLSFAIGGLVVVVVILISVSGISNRSGVDMENGRNLFFSSEPTVAQLKDNAFGVLSDLNVEKSSSDEVNMESVPAGAGGGRYSTPPGNAESKIDYPFGPMYYSYVYAGEEIVIEQEKMDVFRKVPTSGSVKGGSVTGRINFNLFDLGKVGDANVGNISFVDNSDFGYRTEIDFTNGSAYIYKNWEKWPNYYSTTCTSEGCYETDRPSLSDIPDDEVIVAVANDFLSGYGIDTSIYGEPEVNRDFLMYYKNIEDAYIPDEVTVIYPFLINDIKVYEGYGNISGLNVNYDVRSGRVSAVNNLTVQNYESSLYDTERDFDKIINSVNSPDRSKPVLYDERTESVKVTIELDTPFVGLEHFWRYDKTENKSYEYLVPALIFPVKSISEDNYYWKKRVIVPIIKDFINQSDGDPIRIMEKTAVDTDVDAAVSEAVE
ncbi:MAG: hypothetical protein PHI66_00295 [Candidatus Pacebacteria bacterium]|nr:hypothetical protein [Candidatus Paceibacterota bacterium]